MSVLDIDMIKDLFPDALVTVYGECIVMVMRCPDKRQPHGKKKQQLEQLLKKDIMLCCGVSMVFNNFMYLRYYYTQSRFAAAQRKQPLSPAFCLYEDYHADHIIKTLSAETDLRCFCHPGILSLWESNDEAQRGLVHCLYHYFLNGKNISAAAEALHIHRNTLIYRLGKAEEIMNIDIKQLTSDQLFLFTMSCLIVQRL
jgi:sugar diacid utilization regulator